MTTTFELVFHITGKNYQRVCQYRQEMDLRVIKDQIARRGSALLVSYQGQQGFKHINEIPQLGEAVPWYGNVGAAYRYTFHPEPDGCSLRVENLAGGFSMFSTEALPPLELHLSERIQPRPTAPLDLTRSPLFRVWTFREDEDLGVLTLLISAEMSSQLIAWSCWGEKLTDYQFIFTPSSIGTAVQVKHLTSGESLDLTKDANW